MGKVHYVAVHSDSGCFRACCHKHSNITTATACISEPGGYVVAVRRRKYRQLTDKEEAEYQQAKYGKEERRQRFPDLALLVTGLKVQG
jgi:hypothetical protein